MKLTIDNSHQINLTTQDKQLITEDTQQSQAQPPSKTSSADSNVQINHSIPELNLKYHEAARLLQSITKEPLTGEIIRKIPSDEMLELYSLLDEYIQNIVNNSV